jgi:signal transduction histidine kinase/AraC-like DNA-binding protein
MAINYANIGAIYFDRGEYNEAKANYIVSLEYNEKAGLPMGIALCRINIGRIYEVQRRLDEALEEFEQAYEVMSGTSDKWHWLDACLQVASIHIQKGDFARARQYLARGMSIAREINSLKHIRTAHNLYSVYHYGLGDYRRAVEDIRTAQAYADTLDRNLEVERLLESRVKYETATYSQKIEELDALNSEQVMRRKRITLITTPVIILLVVVVLLVLYRRRLERRQAAEVKKLERMRSNFFTNITHEFRTPITVINGLADHLLAGTDNPDNPYAKDVEAIRRQGGQLMHLVNQLLDFSRSEAGVDRPRWRHGDIVEYLQVIAEPYAQYARRRGIDLFVYSEQGSMEMNFAPSHLRKIIGNLLSNAIKHTPEGGRIIVHLRAEEGARRCRIEVRDNGEGIAPENLPRIFELYYTSATGKSGISSSGIGLALTRQLVEEVGGRISVASTPGRGAEFTVSLPVSSAPIPEEEREESEGDSLAEIARDIAENGEPELGTQNGGKTILIVEDTRDVAHYISTILGAEYTLLHASEGDEGLRMAERHIPDLIITDVMMPVKDGYAFTADLRASVAVSHIPVIMITALGETENKLTGLRAGADAYLPKPFDERELRARVRQLLDSRAMLMELYSGALMAGGFETGDAGDIDVADHDRDFIARLSIAINGHLDDDAYFPVRLAADMCLSVSQLNRKLKAMTGNTVSSFVMGVRLQRAKLLLSKGGLSVKEVAFACGFSDLGYFSRSFKNAFGCTPSQFVKPPEQ